MLNTSMQTKASASNAAEHVSQVLLAQIDAHIFETHAFLDWTSRCSENDHTIICMLMHVYTQ